MIIPVGNGNKGNVTVLHSHNCDCSMGHTVTDQADFVTRRLVTIVTFPGLVTVNRVAELHLIESRRGHKKRVEFEPAFLGGLFVLCPYRSSRKG